VKADDRTEPYPSPTPAVQTVKAYDKTEPEHEQLTPPVETVRADQRVEPERKEPAVETVYADPQVEPPARERSSESAVPTLIARASPPDEPVGQTAGRAALERPLSEPAVPTVMAAPVVQPPVLP
jgi:hypothetical protein